MLKERKNFKVLLVYPNLPLMLVPPLSMAIFTDLLKKKDIQSIFLTLLPIFQKRLILALKIEQLIYRQETLVMRMILEFQLKLIYMVITKKSFGI